MTHGALKIKKHLERNITNKQRVNCDQTILNSNAPSSRLVSCDFCKEDGADIFSFEMLDDWFGGFCGDTPITPENACRTINAVFIDRGYIRMVDVDESQCMDHGEKRKINYCPFCGGKL